MVRCSVWGGCGVSKRNVGPLGVEDGSAEKSEERSGRMKRRRSGRRLESADESDGAGSSACRPAWASRGRRRGMVPPNWCTRNPGPPFMLNTKPDPPSGGDGDDES